MAAGFDALAQAGVQNAEAQAAQKRQLQDTQIQNALAGAKTQEERNAILHDALQKDPNKLKQFIDGLGARLTGKQPQPTISPYSAPSITTQTAITNPETGEPIAPAQPLTVKGPAPKTKQEALAGYAARGETPEQKQLETFKAETEAQQSGELAGKKGLAEWQAGFDREQADKQTQAFADTYERITGKKASPELLQAFTVSAFGGDKVLSVMEQQEALKARTDYQNATLQLREATNALNKAKFDASQNPNSPAFQLKLRQAQTAAERAQSYWVSAQARAYGAVNGVPLAGAMIDSEGNPIGAEFQSNVRPTGTQRERATLATSALDQMKDLTGLLSTRSDLFGPGAGRITNFRQWVGSQDPDAQRFQAAARTAADHLAGVFGGRSKAALDAIYDIIGNNITNPKAAIAGINQMAQAASVIQGVGSYATVGGGAASPTGGKGAPAPKKNPGDDTDLQKRLLDATQ